jgi:hypothetical protein
MSLAVKGEQVKLLELSMIRRYGTSDPIVDPAVARILVEKGLALYLNERREVIPKIEKEDNLFPIEVIKE